MGRQGDPATARISQKEQGFAPSGRWRAPLEVPKAPAHRWSASSRQRPLAPAATRELTAGTTCVGPPSDPPTAV